MKLQRLAIGVPPIRAYFRPNTSDRRVLAEVLEARVYCLKRAAFDVLPGEHWLDLGANIGAFALYCLARGATVECYEPDPDCFAILERNVDGARGCKLVEAAVSVNDQQKVVLRSSPHAGEHQRGTIFQRRGYGGDVFVRNVPSSRFRLRKFDGVKMDIEGAEGPILDARDLPRCNKFVMEYHTSVDDSMANLARRVAYLRKTFGHVHYPEQLQNKIDDGVERFKPFFDRMIFAWR